MGSATDDFYFPIAEQHARMARERLAYLNLLRVQARHVVLRNAFGAEDARTLLDMLGLLVLTPDE